MCENHKHTGGGAENTTAEMQPEQQNQIETTEKIEGQKLSYQEELREVIKNIDNKYEQERKTIKRFRKSRQLQEISNRKQTEIAKAVMDLNKKHGITTEN